MPPNVISIVLLFVGATAATLFVGFILRWVDRKVTARVQYRVGPPWFQPIADVIKLMGKENLMPATARGTGFLLAPVLGFAATAVAACVLWYAAFAQETVFLGDLIVVVYLLLIPAVMTIVGASASGNPHAAVGASREMKLMLSYELPLFLVIMTAVAKTGTVLESGWTFQLGKMVSEQVEAGSVVFSISGLIAMIVAILCMQAKLGQVPFDLAEAECEIMSGVYVEYSGPSLAMFLMTKAMLLALMPLLLIMVFWGGINTGGFVWGIPAFLGKYVLLVALVTLIRNTNPRLRIDQTLRFFWFVLTPIALLALVLALTGISEGLSWL